MIIRRSLKNLPSNAVYTIGNFDGLHRGHADLLSVVASTARQKKLPAVVITFYPHPRNVLDHGDKPKKIYTLQQTASLLEQGGIQELIFVHFSKSFAATPYEEFLSMLLKPGDTLILGQDAALGANRKGDTNAIASWCLNHDVEFRAMTLKKIDGVKIGSGALREAIIAGEVVKAREILGRPFSLHGLVVHGDARGRLLGFPTANMRVAVRRVVPCRGVYASSTIIEGISYKSITNVGVRPTFDGVPSTLVETHIFDFNKDIYGKKIEVFLHSFIRDEKKFISKEELIIQIQKDCSIARQGV